MLTGLPLTAASRAPLWKVPIRSGWVEAMMIPSGFMILMIRPSSSPEVALTRSSANSSSSIGRYSRKMLSPQARWHTRTPDTSLANASAASPEQ